MKWGRSFGRWLWLCNLQVLMAVVNWIISTWYFYHAQSICLNWIKAALRQKFNLASRGFSQSLNLPFYSFQNGTETGYWPDCERPRRNTESLSQVLHWCPICDLPPSLSSVLSLHSICFLCTWLIRIDDLQTLRYCDMLLYFSFDFPYHSDRAPVTPSVTDRHEIFHLTRSNRWNQ